MLYVYMFTPGLSSWPRSVGWQSAFNRPKTTWIPALTHQAPGKPYAPRSSASFRGIWKIIA